jgi:pilus assembly protein CpaF
VRPIREQSSAALDLIVHLTRFKDGSRRITHVTEVLGMEGEVITLQDIFAFNHKAGETSPSGRIGGELQPTGIRPQFIEKLAERGIELAADLFMPQHLEVVR